MIPVQFGVYRFSHKKVMMRKRYFTHTGDGLLVFEDTIV
jgi:hypothetical protein